MISSPTSEPPSDEDLFQALVREQEDALARLFHANGSPRPMVLWQPQFPDLADPRQREFLTLGRELAQEGGLPHKQGFLDALPEQIRNSISLVSTSPEGQLSYDYFGKEIAEQYGRRLSGPMHGQIPDHIVRFYTAVFRATQERRQGVLTEHEPPSHVFVQAWSRLSVPLTEKNGDIRTVAIMNIARNPLRVGMDVVHVPVFVLGDDQGILYANPPARLMMPKGDGRLWGGDFFDETGIALPSDLPSAAELMGHRKIETRRSLVLRDSLLSESVVSISAVIHRTWPCYVVMVRPD